MHANTIKESVHAFRYALNHSLTYTPTCTNTVFMTLSVVQVWHALLMRHTWTFIKTAGTNRNGLGLLLQVHMTRMGCSHKSRQRSNSSALIK